MSRCFPYPPPGYAGKCASNEALIWTIKLQRESEKTKSEKKKDRRKEKKEKKEKKREDKAKETICSEKKIVKDEKLYQAGKYGKYPEATCQIKHRESAYDNMEKSNLTEEHGKPCCSSDSTENSGKRKRQSPPQASNVAGNPGTVIRIVLNSRKKEDCPTPTTSSKSASLSLPTGRVDSTSSKNVSLSLPTGRVDSSSQKADVKTLAKLRISPPKSNTSQQLTISSNKEKLPCPDKRIDQGSTSKDEKKLPRPLRKYKALFENWVQPPMECELAIEDEDWLFGSKKEVSQPAKRMKCCKEEVASCEIPAMQPQVQHLSECDIYALPFTVPF